MHSSSYITGIGTDNDHVTSYISEQIMDMIGLEIAKMHSVGIIHGDLTTSNFMIRRRLQPKDGEAAAEIVRLLPISRTSTSFNNYISRMLSFSSILVSRLNQVWLRTRQWTSTFLSEHLPLHIPTQSCSSAAFFMHTRLTWQTLGCLFTNDWKKVSLTGNPTRLQELITMSFSAVRLRGRKRSMIG
jgi:hypothetical protein